MDSMVGKSDEFIALLERADFFLKQIKDSLYLELLISTKHSFLKHLVLNLIQQIISFQMPTRL